MLLKLIDEVINKCLIDYITSTVQTTYQELCKKIVPVSQDSIGPIFFACNAKKSCLRCKLTPLHLTKSFISKSTRFSQKLVKRSSFLFRRQAILLTKAWWTVGVTMTVTDRVQSARCGAVTITTDKESIDVY